MTINQVPHPPIVSRAQWLSERKKLLAHEKELTRQYDRVNAERRRLPMVKIEKNYMFEGPAVSNLSRICSRAVGNSSSITSCSIRHGRKAARAVPATPTPSAISACWTRATPPSSWCRARRWPSSRPPRSGWDGASRGVPRSAASSTTIFMSPMTRRSQPVEYNYRNKAELEANKVPNATSGEEHGLSVFFSIGDDCFTPIRPMRAARSADGWPRVARHDALWAQQEFEDSQPGWPQKPTYG